MEWSTVTIVQLCREYSCLRTKRTKNLKGRLRRHMLLSANMRAKSHLCNPDCAVEVDIDDGYLPDPDLPFAHQK
uniref:Uncharacterized protein n=1 Tax=Caenorhabditis japonica TaxID=281687 RepID=A0A8R1IA97_CAEJA